MVKRILPFVLAGMVTGLVAQPPNLSFKRGAPISHAQILLGARSMGGRTIVPSVALGYFSLSYKSSWSDDYDSGDYDFSIHLFIPKVGIRVLGARNGDLRSYTLAEVFYLLPVVNGSEFSESDKKELRDALDLIGLTFGFGAEYFLSDQFSVGSEAALNMIYHSTERTDDFANYLSESRTILSALMTNFTLNYYFRE
ncbi:MAG: hypothetical protein IIA59_04260 [Candidatus Marinimicrobia bacterium]|nr:hypothetical protein [Candidatus Neomarinimicrobiota bacterium]